jgi:rod shape-determining protein MreC
MPNRSRLVIFILVVLSLTMMGLPEVHQNKISDYSRSTILNSGQWLFSRVARYSRSERKSRYLLAENVRLSLENMQLREAAEENRRLRLELEFPQRRPFSNLIPAEVIGRDPDQLYDTIVINAGSNAGIETEQPVVTAAGLVGHVIHVGENASTVQLIMRSRVSSVVQRGRAQGIISWVPGGRFQLRYVDASSIIEPGDRVVTSGLGGRYPKGITVGYVTEVKEQQKDPLFKAVFLQSDVDFWDLEEVFVMGDTAVR